MFHYCQRTPQEQLWNTIGNKYGNPTGNSAAARATRPIQTSDADVALVAAAQPSLALRWQPWPPPPPQPAAPPPPRSAAPHGALALALALHCAPPPDHLLLSSSAPPHSVMITLSSAAPKHGLNPTHHSSHSFPFFNYSVGADFSFSNFYISREFPAGFLGFGEFTRMLPIRASHRIRM
jgi:hypothetical protein